MALVTSACASVAAIVQTNSAREQTATIAKQLGASVWPYLTIGYTFSQKSLKLTIVNEGLGPALIETVGLSIDNKPTSDLKAVIKLIDPHSNIALDESDIRSGSVIRASETFTLFSIKDARLDEPKLENGVVPRISVAVCYCSLLADCWMLQQRQLQPVPVAKCGPPGSRLVF